MGFKRPRVRISTLGPECREIRMNFTAFFLLSVYINSLLTERILPLLLPMAEYGKSSSYSFTLQYHLQHTISTKRLGKTRYTISSFSSSSGECQKGRRAKKNPKPLETLGVLGLAEKEGFEPSIPFWGIHDFQSCALGQLRDFSITVLSVQPGYNTTGNPICQA